MTTAQNSTTIGALEALTIINETIGTGRASAVNVIGADELRPGNTLTSARVDGTAVLITIDPALRIAVIADDDR